MNNMAMHFYLNTKKHRYFYEYSGFITSALKISGRTSIKIQHCGYESVLGEHIENKLVEWLITFTGMGFAMSVVQPRAGKN